MKGILERCYKKMELMEVEGRFQLIKSVLPIEERHRIDKVLEFNFNEIEKIEELKDIYSISRSMYFLPFELNKYNPSFAL